MPPTFAVTIGSNELGLTRGSLSQLDEQLRRFDRERVALRIISILNVLGIGEAAGRKKGEVARSLSEDYVRILPPLPQRALASALGNRNAIFFDPWQQLLLLKRSLIVSPIAADSLDFVTTEGETAFFDACRFAEDLLIPNHADAPSDSEDHPTRWARIAAGMMPRLWMMNPPNPAVAMARFRVMFERIPQEDPTVAKRVAALDQRFPDAMNGLTFTETSRLVNFLGVWSIRHKPADIFRDPSILRLNPDTFLKRTTFAADTLERFVHRTAISVADGITDDGGNVSPLIFRDRPLLRFSDGTVAPVFPPFLLEKLTQDIFWWLKPLGADQRQRWQDQWGYIAEAYAIRILQRCGNLAACSFRPRLLTSAGEIDALLWKEGHVAVFEVTSSGLRASEGTSVKWEHVRDGLRRAFVERPPLGKKPAYKEAILQLVRDVKLLLNGQVDVPIANLQRVYPVMIGTDRSVRSVGVCPFLEDEFASRLDSHERQRVAGLAVWGLEDLEGLESQLHARSDLQKGTPSGLIRVLRRWDLERGPAPSWWQFIEATYGGDRGVNDELSREFDAFRAALPTFFRREDENVG